MEINEIIKSFSELMETTVQICEKIAKLLLDFCRSLLRTCSYICQKFYPKFAHLALYSKKSRVRKKYFNRLKQKLIMSMLY